MNRTLLVPMILCTQVLFAQPGPGKVEVSLSGSLQSISTGSSKASTNILIVPRIGFFPVAGLEIEPEAIFLKPEEGEITYVLNGNVSYNFVNPGKAVPFLLAGYGISNTIPLFNVPLVRYDFTVGVLNLGGGIKAMLAENVAVRIEYRFQKFTGEKQVPVSYGSYVEKADTKMHTFQFGFSVFL